MGEEREKMERESEVKASRFKRVCVFCGSSQGKKASYQEAAIELGKVLVKTKIFSFPILYVITSINVPIVDGAVNVYVMCGISHQNLLLCVFANC